MSDATTVRRGASRLEVRESLTKGGDPLVCIVIVNWRGWRDTIECLESVYRMRYGNFRIVVCNNDPGDRSLERIERWARGVESAGGAGDDGNGGAAGRLEKPVPFGKITVASECPPMEQWPPLMLMESGGNLGFAGGNNVVLEKALAAEGCDYVWLLNNDTVVDPDALGSMVALAEQEPEAGMIGSKLLNYDRPDVIQVAAGGRLSVWKGLTTFESGEAPDDGRADDVRGLEYITGASLLVRMAVVREIGLLDPRYFLYSEEVDWCIRARRAGWTLLYAPGSRVWHKGGQSVGYGSPLHDYYTVRSMLLLVQKFYPLLLPITFLYSLYRCLAPKIVRWNADRFRAVLAAYRDFLRIAAAPDRPPPRFASPGRREK